MNDKLLCIGLGTYCLEMAQYYQIIQGNVEGLNLENCVIMNEDGTPISPRSVSIHNEPISFDFVQFIQSKYRFHFFVISFNAFKVVLSDPNQIIENHQMPQIIYQPNTQPNQQTIQTPDGQIINYIVQEDDLQNDNYNLVQQAPQQVYYQKITTENGQQYIQHRGNSIENIA